MEHAKILAALINSMIGIWVIFFIINTSRKHPAKFLRPLIKYTVVYNLIILLLLFSKYSDLNLPADFFLNQLPYYEDLLHLGIFILVMGLLYYMIAIIAGFNNKEIGKRLKIYLLIIFGSLIMIHSLNILFNYLDTKIAFFDFIYQYILDNLILGEALLLIWLGIFYKKYFSAENYIIIKSFAYLYLIRYLIICVIFFFPSVFVSNMLLRILSLFLFFLILNLIPVIWIKFYLLRHIKSILPALNFETIFNKFCTQHRISKREQEILKLLLEGNSNRQIEDRLFISFHTVKNHIYHIFKKLGVQSRYQLINQWTTFCQNL